MSATTFRPITTLAGDDAELVELIERDFATQAPARKLVGDIPCIPMWEGRLYVATVLDCFTMKALGYAMADHLRTELVTAAPRMAARNVDFTPAPQQFEPEQYTSWVCGQRLRGAGLLGSMGSIGDCFDNPMVKSFFGTTQLEPVEPDQGRPGRSLPLRSSTTSNLRQPLLTALETATPSPWTTNTLTPPSTAQPEYNNHPILDLGESHGPHTTTRAIRSRWCAARSTVAMLYVNCVRAFPVALNGDFRVLQYTISSARLTLHSFGSHHNGPGLEILFDAVERMELDPRFTGGLTLTPLTNYRDFDNDAALPLLLLRLDGGVFGSGFVACAEITARRVAQLDVDGVSGGVLFHESASRSAHGVGGCPAEHGATAFGRPVLRRYAPEKRITRRFPPPSHHSAAPENDRDSGL